MKLPIDFIITISGEKVQGFGEDASFKGYLPPLGAFGVFDGCGGIGSQKYEIHDGKTGAYLAATTAALVTEKYFAENREIITEFNKTQIEKFSAGLSKEIKKSLLALDKECTAVCGSLVKRFPTTAAIIAFKEEKKTLSASFIWAGDSRGYILEEDGLVQITRDDIIGEEDAFSNIESDARLSNFISADGSFSLRIRMANITWPSLLITATDGCFGYFSTPMEFEYVLLDTLIKSDGCEEWKARLYKELADSSGDDFTINICAVGFGSFEKLRKTFLRRTAWIKKKYIDKLSNSDREKREKLWNKYKKDYYA